MGWSRSVHHASIACDILTAVARRFTRPTWLRYFLALVFVAIVIEMRHLMGIHLKMEGPPLIMMFSAVIAAGWFGGMGPGVTATLVGAAACDYFFIQEPEKHTILQNPAAYDIRLGFFVVEGFVVSWLLQVMMRMTQESRQAERNLRLIADNTFDAIFAYDMAMQLLYVNQAFETLTGHSMNELRENPFMNYIHPDDSPRIQPMLDQTFKGKSFRDLEYRIIAHDGQVKWCRASWGPLLDKYNVQVGVQGRETDITIQKRSLHMLQFLAETATILAANEPPEASLVRIARAAVPQFADWCVIDLALESQDPRTIAAAHADSSRQPWVTELQRNYAPLLESSEGRGKVLQSGQPQIATTVTPTMLSAMAQDARHLKLLQNLSPRSLLCVPMKAGGRTLGSIMFVSSETGHRYTAEDLAFAADLASRIATTLPIAVPRSIAASA